MSSRSGIQKLRDLSLLLDENTRRHCTRVRRITVAIGQRLGLPEQQLTRLAIAAQFHDIGKLAVDPEILNHRGTLNELQWQQIVHHPEIGAELWRAFVEDDAVAAAILCHHERFDGTGYPNGLSGHHIPLWSRIIAVADALDAMVSGRPYREPVDLSSALFALIGGSGTQFDPHIIRNLLHSTRRHPRFAMPAPEVQVARSRSVIPKLPQDGVFSAR